MTEWKISCRTFISTTAMAGLAMALDWGKIYALAAKIQDKKNLPVGVIGAGLGGLCCGALLAKRGYTLNPGGAIYGFPCTVENSFMNRIKSRTPIKGLYLASAWGNAGPGYAPALKGGERTFKQVLEDLA